MAPTSVEDLERMSKSLDKMATNHSVDKERAKRYLYRLRDSQITLTVLQQTGLGITVNKLRRATDDEELISVSRELIKNWKKLLPDEEPQQTSSQPSSDRVKDDCSSPAESADSDAGRSSSNSANGEDNGPAAKVARMSSTDEHQHQVLFAGAKANATDDPFRLKCREMLKNALETDTLPEDCYDPEYLAAELESSIYREIKSSEDTKYKNRIRSRITNLRDPKNPQLRENLLLGQLKPDRLAKMTAEEMASDEMRNLRERYTKEAIDDHQLAVTSGTKTSLLTCKRCKGTNCMYNQVQTRSADEPMTTFVWCNDCGQRWKFC